MDMYKVFGVVEVGTVGVVECDLFHTIQWDYIGLLVLSTHSLTSSMSEDENLKMPINGTKYPLLSAQAISQYVL